MYYIYMYIYYNYCNIGLDSRSRNRLGETLAAVRAELLLQQHIEHNSFIEFFNKGR